MTETDKTLDSFDLLRATVKDRSGVLRNRYVTALESGELERDDFVESQTQFLFAVVFFSRPMAVLAGRLPRPEMRLALLDNVLDEHGHGNPSLTHERTFLELLGRFGMTPAQIEGRALWPEVRAFNTALTGLCTMDDTYTALAALGIIEDSFATLSARIGQALVARGWLPAERVVHYALHEELDVLHAEGFYRTLRVPFAAHPRHRYQIAQGLELGAYLFRALYDGLYDARGRRWLRDVGGPHSLAEGWWLDSP